MKPPKSLYPVVFYPEAEGGFSVEVPDLPGCMSQGETLEEAWTNIQDAQMAWMEVVIREGDAIPPRSRRLIPSKDVW